MENFTPVSAFSGGLMIGLAAAVLILANGRIAGVSGIAGGLLSPAGGDIAWRMAFITGLVLGPLIYNAAAPETLSITVTRSVPVLIAGGLMVGFGTRLGSGCTSGHGVCGIGRLSNRSMVATCVFMAAAAVTVFAARHLLGS